MWLDVANAKIMVSNICDGLCTLMPEHEAKLRQNCDAYLARLDALDQELRAGTADLQGSQIVTFHEAFPYFAKAYGLQVVGVVTVEPGETLSPRGLSELIGTIRTLGNPPLFAEPQYDNLVADTVAAETGAKVWILDPVVTGPMEPAEAAGYYEVAMRRNLSVLRQALAGAED